MELEVDSAWCGSKVISLNGTVAYHGKWEGNDVEVVVLGDIEFP